MVETAGASDEVGIDPRGAERWLVRVLVGAVVVGVIAFGALIAYGIVQYGKPGPTFPALADHPDPTLRGTVAWLDSSSQCVRVRPASGRPTTKVFCFGTAAASHDLDWTSLTWLPDGRLQITTHAWPTKKPIRVDSQRIVDVTTREVTTVPKDDWPAAAIRDRGRDRVNAKGERLTVTRHCDKLLFVDTGCRATLAVSGPSGSRALLTARGGAEYNFDDPAWGPDGRWAVVGVGSDLLLVTTGPRPRARTLLTTYTSGFSAGTRGWAITGTDMRR